MSSYEGSQDCYCNVGYYAPIVGVLGPTVADFKCQGSWEGVYLFDTEIDSRPVYRKSASQVFMLMDYGAGNIRWETRDSIDSGSAYLYSPFKNPMDLSIFYPTQIEFLEWCGSWTLSPAKWRSYHTSVCQACPAHSSNIYHGSRDCLCNAGYSRTDSGMCSACDTGKYKAAIGSATCTDCPSGKVTTSTGQTAATACVCPANSYSDNSCVDSTTWTAGYGLCDTYMLGHFQKNNKFCVEDGACPNCCIACANI